MEEVVGIPIKDIIKIKSLMLRFDINIDELISCMDFEKYKGRAIKKLEKEIEKIKDM